MRVVRRRLLALVLAAAACSKPAPFTVRDEGKPPPASTGASTAGGPPAAAAHPPGPGAVPAGSERVRVLLFGDFGETNDQQRAVASAMAAEHRARPFDVGFSLGDNIYPCGPDVTAAGAAACRFDASGNTVEPGFASPADARFSERYEQPLQPLSAPPRAMPIYVALGNHDVAAGLTCREGGLSGAELAKVRACLEVAHRSPAWNMPGRHYVVDRGPARFVVIDSNLLLGDYGGFTIDGEVAFVAEAVRGAGDRRVFVMAHHPAATAGKHRADFGPAYLERLGRVLAAGGGAIAGWFAGHDHVLQQLRSPAGLDVFVSGNGALARPEERFDAFAPAGAHIVFATTGWGYGILEVTRDRWAVRFQDERGKALHCCEAVAKGPCEPVSCPVR